MKKVGYQRWIMFPFSLGCSSKSSVAVAAAASDSNNATPTRTIQRRQKDSSIIKKGKHHIGFSLPKRNISHRIQTLIKRLKNVPQFFVYKNESKYDEEEMEIGYPTDVKHLTHIGWDGSTTITNSIIKVGENLTPSEIVSFPSISLKQFELAMEAQAAQGNVPSKQLICNESKS